MRIVLHRFIQRLIVFYRFRTVRPFRLNGWGVSYNGKGRSVFVSFRKNGTITLYCHIPYAEVLDNTLVRMAVALVVLQT